MKILFLMRFFRTFTKELGGLHVFIMKIFMVLRQQGITGAYSKTRYLLKHAGIQFGVGDKAGNYKNWITRFEKLTDEDISAMKELQKSFNIQPLISVLLPTYNSNARWLKEAIDSVRNQIYPNWELCIADDASTLAGTREMILACQRMDERIKVVFIDENRNISGASNRAIEMASGDFVALLDHDDLLSKNALFCVVEAINKHPDAALIYSDEDKIDNHGHRSDPHFKTDWNYSLFISQNMISHLGVYRMDIVRKIGGFRLGFEGSQDYDLALRFIEQIREDQIVHLPKILYHWRIHKDSTSKGSDKKPYTITAGSKAIDEHLQRKNIQAEIINLPSFYYRVKYKLPANVPLVSIIVPTHNNHFLLKKCISGIIYRTVYPEIELIVVNNNSDDPETLSYLNELKQNDKIRVIEDNNPFNFSAINNRAVQQAKGEFLCLLNDDTEAINDDWLNEMVSIGLQPGVGIIGAKLYYPNDTLQHGGVILGIGGVAGHSHKYFHRTDRGYFGRLSLMQELSAVTAACMLVRKSVFLQVDGFNENDLSVAFNDVDFCLKVKSAGYKIVWTPFAELYHYESASRGDDLVGDMLKRFHEEVYFMIRKWGNALLNDPAYSPNLTLQREDFSYALQPRANDISELFYIFNHSNIMDQVWPHHTTGKYSKTGNQYVPHDFEKIWKIFPINRPVKEQMKNILFRLFPVFFRRWEIYQNWKNAEVYRKTRIKLWHPAFWGRRLFNNYTLSLNKTTEIVDLQSQENNLAVVIHAFYTDIFFEVYQSLLNVEKTSLSLYLTGPGTILDEIKAGIANPSIPVHYFPAINHGRDILPFLKVLPKVFENGHTIILKLHTKRSNHLNLKEHWRNDLLSKLIGEGKITRAMEIFSSGASIGMIGPAGNILPMQLYYASNGRRVKELANRMGVNDNQLADLNFVAGSMFYARREALLPVLNLNLAEADFEAENGQKDGTMAHAVERAFAAGLIASGFQLADTDFNSENPVLTVSKVNPFIV